MKIAFRVDGGKSIGMGHIMRCLSLANELRKNNYKVYFISKYEEGIEKIKSNDFEIIKIHCEEKEIDGSFNYGDMEELENEATSMIRILKEKNIEALIVDSYNVSKEYLLKLKNSLRILTYIDDINKFTYPADILINGNIFATNMNYKKYCKSEILLLGMKYNLIREEFKNLSKRKLTEEVKNIVITTGGSDPRNITCNILNQILADDTLKYLSFNVIVGSGFTNKDEIYSLVREHKNIKVYENPKNISYIMLNSDIAISSGGSTLYELCSCGTPTLAFIYADNQEPLVEKLYYEGYINNLGWYNEDFKLPEKLVSLVNDFPKRINMSEQGQNLVDGKGTERIVREITKIILEKEGVTNG